MGHLGEGVAHRVYKAEMQGVPRVRFLLVHWFDHLAGRVGRVRLDDEFLINMPFVVILDYPFPQAVLALGYTADVHDHAAFFVDQHIFPVVVNRRFKGMIKGRG